MAEIKNFPQARTRSFISNSGRTKAIPSKGSTLKDLPRSPSVSKPANQNTNPKRAALEKNWKAGDTARTKAIISNAKAPSVASRVAGALGRFAGPVGALVGMTEPAGVGSDKPPKGIKGMNQRDQAAANEATSAKRPTSSSLNAPARTKPSGSARPTSNSLSAPARTSSSSYSRTQSSYGDMRSGPGSTGGSKTGSSSGSTSSGGMRSGPGSTGGSKTAGSSSSASRSTGPSRGPTSAPSRTEPSRANLGTSRFSKGGAIKRRKKR